jgi:predicted phosphodiesterase
LDKKLYAIVSDIHANYQALLKVEKDARQIAQEEGAAAPVFICLGDIVDYGPQPNECVAWVLENVPETCRLRGNHDDIASQPLWRRPTDLRVDPQYWPITIWTRFTLTSMHREALRAMPEVALCPNGLGEFQFFHSHPVAGNDTRIEDGGNASHAIKALWDGRRCGIFGHTHFQMMFSPFKSGSYENSAFVVVAQPEFYVHESAANKSTPSSDHWPVNTWHHLPRGKVLINAGSVGQPRAHLVQEADLRAGYLLLKKSGGGWRFQWRRVEYDQEMTIDLLEALPWPSTGSNGQNGNDILKDSSRGRSESENRSSFAEAEIDELRKRFPETIRTMVAILRSGK